MKKSKIPLKTRIKLLDIKGWACSLGTLAAAITVVVFIDKAVTGIPIKAEEPEPISKTVEAVEVIPEQDTTAAYYEEIPLAAELQTFIITECERLNIRPAIIFAMCQRETNYAVDAIGDNGESYGVLQIQPKWHYNRMLELGCTDLLDPKQNVTVALDYLIELINRYDGDICSALVAYNQGSYNGVVTEYAETVINEAERLDTYVLQ